MSYGIMMQYRKAGEEFWKKGDFSRAEKFFKSAVEEAQLYQPANEYTVQQLKTLGLFYLSLRAFARAEPFLQRALEIERDLFEPQDIVIARSLNLLGLLYQLWGDFSRAEAAYQQAMKIEQKAQFLRNPQIDTRLSHQSQHHLAMVYCAQGRQDEAYRICTCQCAKAIRTMGPAGRHLTADLHNLAMQYCSQGRQSESLRLSEWILDLAVEQSQKEYLGATLREAKKGVAAWDEIPNPVYESLGITDEVWRPSAVYRHDEPSFRSPEEEPRRWAQSGDRFSTAMEEAWSPAQSFAVKKN